MRILITGKDGLLGKALQRESKNYPKYEFIFIGRKDFDLRYQDDAQKIFYRYNPLNAVIHCAASVGGYAANHTKPADFYRDNILMNTHLIHYAYQYLVTKFIGIGSICSLCDNNPPLTENNLHSGPPHPIHEAYAQSKRMIDVQMRAYKKQYGLRNYCNLILTNLLGIEDNYDLELGHIIPSLIHKLYRAKTTGEPFCVWGTGEAAREFIDADDVAKVCMKLLELDTVPSNMIVSSRWNYKIKDVVKLLCEISNYPFKDVVWELNKPDGQLIRNTDTSLFKETLPEIANNLTPLVKSLERSYLWFAKNFPNCRGVK